MGSLLCTIQRKQNQADGYVCLPTEHAIKENNMPKSETNPANYITQLLQAGSFGGIQQASIAQSEKMDYCTMDRLASQEVTIALKGSSEKKKKGSSEKKKKGSSEKKKKGSSEKK